MIISVVLILLPIALFFMGKGFAYSRLAIVASLVLSSVFAQSVYEIRNDLLASYFYYEAMIALIPCYLAMAWQDKYMLLEANLINSTLWKDLVLADKIRKLIYIAPVITPFYCLFFKMGILDGKKGYYYAVQRTVAELILSLKLMELRLNING